MFASWKYKGLIKFDVFVATALEVASVTTSTITGCLHIWQNEIP